MSRPPLEVADIIRAAGDAFIERNRHWLGWKHVKVLLAIARCSNAALGSHLDECTSCGHRAISFNSCRNRHCPKCQTAARERWIAARQRELLPTRYLHVVFTLPRHLAPLVLQNKKVIYGLLFRTSAETLLEVARNPQHLGAEIGFFSVLHTWSQQLNLHPHVHCVVPAGGLSPDHSRWIHARENYFLPKKVLSKVFRGKFVSALERALLPVAGRNPRTTSRRTPLLYGRRSRSLSLSQVWWTHEDHRKAHCCRDPTPFSTTVNRCGMKPLSPTRKLCALRRAPHFSTSPPHLFPLQPLQPPSSPRFFASRQLWPWPCEGPCSAAQPRHISNSPLPSIEFA